MSQDAIKKLISAYVDGEVSSEEAVHAVEAIKNELEIKAYYRDLLRLRKTIKRLDNPSAYRSFKRAWRKQIGIIPVFTFSNMPVVRYASLAAAGVVVATVGLFMILNQPPSAQSVNDSRDAASFSMQENDEMMMAEEAAPLMEEAAPVSGTDSGLETFGSEPAKESLMLARGGAMNFELPIENYDAFIQDISVLDSEYLVEQTQDETIVTVYVRAEEALKIKELLIDYAIDVNENDISDQSIIIVFLK